MSRELKDIETILEWARARGDPELVDLFLEQKKVAEERARVAQIRQARVDAKVEAVMAEIREIKALLGLTEPQEEQREAPPARPSWNFFHFFKMNPTTARPYVPCLYNLACKFACWPTKHKPS